MVPRFLSHASTRRDAWLLFGCALVVLAAGMGLRDPWPADEPRFALVAKQMWDSGNFLIPHRGLEPYSDKPPVFMWLQLGAYALSGSWRIAFLLPSLLAALGTLALVYDLSRRVWSARAAWWATALLLLTLHFTYQAKKAQIDPTLVFWVTLSAYGLLRHLLKGPAWGWYWLGWFAAGLGTITKGVGAIALLALVPYAFARWRGWRGLAAGIGGWRGWVAPAFLAAGLAIWLLPMVLATYGSGDPALRAYADDILFRQTAKRYADPWHHVKPAWYYLGVMLPMWMPLNFAWPWAAAAWWRRLRVRRDARLLLPLAWATLVVLFFSTSPGKRDVYILPVLPMLAFASAPLLPGIVRRAGFQRLCFALAALLALATLGAGLAALLGEPRFEVDQELARGLDPAGDSAWWMLATVGAIGVAGLLVFRLRRGLAALATVLAAIWLLAFGVWGYPLINDANSARGVMERARVLAGPDTELGLVAWKEQNLLQALPPVTEFGFLRSWGEQRVDGLAWMARAPGTRRLFVLEEALGPCVQRERAQVVGISNRRTWWLVGSDALIPGCRDVGGGPDQGDSAKRTRE